MTFTERLERIRHDFEHGNTPHEIIDVLDAHIENLIATNADAVALDVGQSALIDQTVHSEDGEIALKELFGNHFLVLTWFRGNW